jgi:tetratricopeptide (TPR) repeat protein
VRLVALVVIAGCYQPLAVRREHTALDPEAAATMAAALAPAPQGPTKQQRFDQHYSAAVAFYEQRKYPEAIAEFEAAYEIDAQPLVLFNIGQAYRKGSQLEAALAKYREYLEKDPAAERDRVRQIIREIEASLARKRR